MSKYLCAEEITIKVKCIGCKTERAIGKAETKKLAETKEVPMCDKCYMPMVARSATQKKRAAK
jgi:hypothetical protein